MSDTHKQNGTQIDHRQERVWSQFRHAERIPATLCFALCLVSGIAYADDNALIREANAALSQKDYRAAFSKFSVLAQQGRAAAQFNLGVFYLNGQGVQRDEKQAFEWFAKSAAQGNAHALQMLQSAAAKGNENAKNELDKIQQQAASRQAQPSGLSQQASSVSGADAALLAEANAALSNKDYVAAFPKLLTLAEQGNAIAQFNVGALYLNGLGTQKDEKQAYDWFAKSAAQGYASAVSAMQSAAVKANEDAKYTPDGGASEPDAKAQAKADAQGRAALHARSERSGFDHYLGVNLGQTGKLTGINNSSSFGLLAGYKINSSFGVELGYNLLYGNANADGMLSAATPGATGTFDLASASVAGQYSYALGNNVSLLGHLGVHKSSYEIMRSSGDLRTGSTSGLLVGLKVQYDPSANLGIRCGFDTYTMSGQWNGNITEFGLAVITRF